eukprot:3477321-Rhodomonas_salina.1
MGALDQASECVKRAVVTVRNRVPREKGSYRAEIGSSPILNVTDAVRFVSGQRPEMEPGLSLARLHCKELSLARGLSQCRACV